MSTTVDETVKGHRDAITVKRVFGEPVERDGVTVLPAAKVMGGGGGGEGEAPEGKGAGKGTGSGFGMAARPAGVYVIRDGDVRWQPALDINKFATGVFWLAALVLLIASRRGRRARRQT